MRASNARPYIMVGSTGSIVGATIGRPLLRLCRQSVTVIPQLIHCHCPWRIGFPSRGRQVPWQVLCRVFSAFQIAKTTDQTVAVRHRVGAV